jgi:hypothetical protein
MLNHSDKVPTPGTVFLIGAQKAGTTALAALLDQHPAISLCREKEPHYFSFHYDRGVEYYDKLFSDRPGALRLDASTSYSVLPSTEQADTAWGRHIPARIKEHHPDARFLYMVRHPVDRAVSAYWHEVRAGREARPLEQALPVDPFYTGTGRYAERLERYLEHFDLDRFLVIDFAEFTRDHIATARACCRHFGIDPEFPFHVDVPRNRSVQYSLPARVVRTLLGSEQRLLSVGEAVRRVVPDLVYQGLIRVGTRPVDLLPEDVRAQLTESYAEDVRRLRALTGLDLLSEVVGNSERVVA